MQHPKTPLLLLGSVSLLAASTGTVHAQDFTISRTTIAGGAATVSAGNLQLAGTTGQALTGSSSGGVFDTSGGVWSSPPALPGCNAADVAEPFGILNFFDVAAYVTLYNTADPAADFAAPIGVLNFFDVASFIATYNAGCR